MLWASEDVLLLSPAPGDFRGCSTPCETQAAGQALKKKPQTLKQRISLWPEFQRVYRTFCTGVSERNIIPQGGGLQEKQRGFPAHPGRGSKAMEIKGKGF